MCGIYGILHLDGALAPAETLPRMGRVTIHRGPDDDGALYDGPCALGMRRLSIIDVAGGHQPLCNEDRTVGSRCADGLPRFGLLCSQCRQLRLCFCQLAA
jgi:asparagine synthase (glutamine-hydrolysing)